MLYSVPYEYIKRKVDVRVTDTIIEIFYNYNRIASHRRLYGRKGQYSTVTEHMPADHQKYLEWDGDRSANGLSGLEPIRARLFMRFLPPRGLSSSPTEAVWGF